MGSVFHTNTPKNKWLLQKFWLIFFLPCETNGYPRSALAMTRHLVKCPVARMMNPKKKTTVSNRRDFLRPIASLINPAKHAETRCPRTQLLAETWQQVLYNYVTCFTVMTETTTTKYTPTISRSSIKGRLKIKLLNCLYYINFVQTDGGCKMYDTVHLIPHDHSEIYNG
jgi:hypothetical protein